MQTNLEKVLESKWTIRFHDCDPYNHLNNSKYIDYIVTARGDQLLDNYGLDIYALAHNENVGWVTANTQITYLYPAFPQEEVIIQTQLLAFSDRSLHFEGLMWNKDKTILKTVMWVRLVHFNLMTQKSASHNGDLISLFEKVVNPLPQGTDFEERIKSLKAGK